MRRPAPFYRSVRIFGLFLLPLAMQILTACNEASSGPAPGDPDAELVLQSPRGGEAYGIGDTLKVRWQARGKGLEEINSVTLELSPDSGESWMFLKNGSIPRGDREWGEYKWVIPAAVTIKGATFGLAGADQVLVRVRDYVNTADPHKSVVLAKPISVQD